MEARSAFDWAKYHVANPDAEGKIQVRRRITYSIEKPRDASYWIRVTSPADPVAEEVALALFGETEASGYIGVSAPPPMPLMAASRPNPVLEPRTQGL
jgi:hypothetical protein